MNKKGQEYIMQKNTDKIKNTSTKAILLTEFQGTYIRVDYNTLKKTVFHSVYHRNYIYNTIIS